MTFRAQALRRRTADRAFSLQVVLAMLVKATSGPPLVAIFGLRA